LGTFAGFSTTSGYRNEYIGNNSARLSTTAYQNACLGQVSCYHNISGHDLTAIGFEALAWITGSADIGLGSGSGNNDGAVSNTLYIGSQTSGLGINTVQIDSSVANGANFTKPMQFSGNTYMPNLTASLPLQLNASKQIISAAINLSGSQVTGSLPYASISGAPAAPASILTYFSDPTHGGAAAEILNVPGLLSTDLIIAVTQKTQGTGNLPLLGWDAQGTATITGHWVGDPVLNAVVQVTVKR
jgi:hypothetical protein